MEEEIKNDDVLKVRLDMRDIRFANNADEEKDDARDTGFDTEKIDVEMKTDEAAVAGELLSDKGNIIDTQGPGPSSSSAGPLVEQDAELSTSRGIKRDDSDKAEDERKQENKRRRLRVLASEKRILGRITRTFGTGSERRKVNAILNQLESNKSTFDRKMDISNLIGALDEEPSPHEEAEEMERWRMLYDGYDFYDDMHDFKKMKRDEVINARRTEMQFFKKMGVYVKVPRETARRHGCKVIATKWLDTNKGDDENPNYRSRMVGREVKYDKRMDLFSATPPLETLKLLISMCARRQSDERPCRLAVIDIKRAYFYAPARRPVFIEIPMEDREEGDEGMVGQLQLSLYGTRDAAQNWAAEYMSPLKSLGFKVGRASPCNFVHEKRGIALTVHGDDFTIIGDEVQLQWIGDSMRKIRAENGSAWP